MSVCNESYDLGQFNVLSSAIKFTDPCYKDDVWCAGDLPALNGKWDSNIGLFRCPHDERDIYLSLFSLRLTRLIYLTAKDDILCLYDFAESLKQCSDLKKLYDTYVKSDVHRHYIDFLVDKFGDEYNIELDYVDKDTWVLRKILNLFHTFMYDSLHDLFLIKELNSFGLSVDSTNKGIEYAISKIGLKIDNSISSYEEAYNNGKPKRTLYLRIKHSSLNEYTPFESDRWEKINSFDVGVDSGQAGFFDLKWFKKYSATYDTTEWEQTYSMLCTLSSDSTSYRNANDPSKKDGGSFEYGCNSHTAYGDGSADLYVIKDVDGNVIEAAYRYCVEEDAE